MKEEKEMKRKRGRERETHGIELENFKFMFHISSV